MANASKYLITGATSGIGRATATELAHRGASLAIVGRDQRALSTLSRELLTLGAPAVDPHCADLALLEPTRRLTQCVAKAPDFDGVFLGAGVLELQRRLTQDGLELNYAVNHLHKFALAEALAPLLADRGGRLVVGAPVGAVKGNLDDLLGERSWTPFQGVSNSQWANDGLAVELARRFGGRGLSTVAWNPGATRGTNVTRSLPRWAKGLFWLAQLRGRSLAEVGRQGADLVSGKGRGPLSWVRGHRLVPSPFVSAEDGARIWELDRQLLAARSRDPSER